MVYNFGKLGLSLGILVILCSVSPQLQGQEIKVLQQWKGEHSGETKKRQVVIRTPKEWREVWEKTHARIEPLPPVPKVDFNKHMVLAVFMGMRRTGGYQIEVAKIEKTDNTLKAFVHGIPTRPNGSATQVITTPYCFAVVQRAERVSFIGE